MQSILAILEQFAVFTYPALRNLVVLGIIFSLLPRFFTPCNEAAPWWRNPGLSTDLCFALIPSAFIVYAQTALLVVGIALCYSVIGGIPVSDVLSGPHGPLGGLSFWQQIIVYLFGNDLLMYLTHRLFHSARLWRFHAVHHSATTVDWTCTNRSHPIDQICHTCMSNIIMLLLGTPPEVIVWLIPWTVGTAALVHANLNWDFGPFRYVLASPVFHRWHHTSPSRGGNRNFAGTFPLFDLIFGTYYMPENERPSDYGLDQPDYPQGFLAQLLRPFMPQRPPPNAATPSPPLG
jgi:sterol desaturase/sphingolipid hydroxylase (fatty acid hydroxylase superfamily)